MGQKFSKKKRSDDSQRKKKRAGKNTPRNVGSTLSLDATEVNTRPNAYVDLSPPMYRKSNIAAPPVLPAKKPSIPKQNLPVVKAMYDYSPQYDEDIGFRRGDRMEVIRSRGDWLLARNVVTKKEGDIPSNYVVADDSKIETQEWWFELDRIEAERQLIFHGDSVGAFLIRNSKENNSHVLSVLEENEEGYSNVWHYLIKRLDDGRCFIKAGTTFADLFELIDYYTIAHRGELRCRLTMPCPRQAPMIPFKELEVKRTDIVLGKRLGEGNFGKVYAGTFRGTVDVAVKCLRPDTVTTEALIDEAKIMHKLRHPKLVQLMGVCTADEPLWIITERMANGALVNFLRNDMGKTIKFPNMIDMAAQISDGMSYLERENYIHRDLRAANVLVAENFNVKVADFGLARMLDSVYEDEEMYTATYERPSTKKWMAPEAATEQEFSIKSDVWSFGILLYELVTYGKHPYAEMSEATALQRVKEGYRMPNPADETIVCPKEFYDIMFSCWHEKPEKRPTFEHLKNVFEDYDVSTETQWRTSSLRR